jgi:hypothetical protein
VASAWGDSWGSSWGDSWGSAASIPAAVAVTTAGRVPAATSYRQVTLGREARDKAREARKRAHKIEVKVVSELRKAEWYNDPEAAKAAVAALRNELKQRTSDYTDPAPLKAPSLVEMLIVMTDRNRIVRAEIDEQNAVFLLLAAA